VMNFPIPMPFTSEYPLILNSWVPTTVSVRDVDDEDEGEADDGGNKDDVVEGFREKSLWFSIVPIN
jgi:hypothetical protein